MFAQVIVDILHEQVAHVFTYLVPDGMLVEVGMRVCVPFRNRKIDGIVLGLTDIAEYDIQKIKPIDHTLETYPAIPGYLIALAQQMAEDAHCPLATTLRLMLPAAMRQGRVKEKKIRMVKLSVPTEKAQAVIASMKRSPKMLTLLTLLLDEKAHEINQLQTLVTAPTDALKRLEAQGLVSFFEEVRMRDPYQGMVQNGADYQLTAQQEEVIDEMLPDLRNGKGRYLLFGVTGSGKTEVYINLVREVLRLGKGAIILVPEIALTPQMVLWFRERFHSKAAVMHSRLSDGERYDEWRRVRQGEARVVIGARSAIFAPVEKLGLIVVDEEHEQSYRSDHFPRYDAREVAVMRADREHAAVLLSSATPSILSFAKARRGDYTLLEMDRRVLNRPLPTVKVVDMRKELENGNRSIFSQALQQGLKKCIENNQQAILFLNRRGFSSFVSCRKCGHVMKCHQCDIALTYHQNASDGMLHCHYCGNALKPPKQCPECQSSYIKHFGLGTQKVEAEVKALFPSIQTLRMDMDTTSGKDAHHQLLSKFRNREAQVLIGTQMIAKGLDFPSVTLVGVVAADMTLNLPDYRSPERTFQLLTQVAGRAGRGKEPGEVIIQTYKPDDSVIQEAAKQDYRAFFETEISRRRTGLYPPFTLLARILIESHDEKLARKQAKTVYNKCIELINAEASYQKRVIFIRVDDAPVKFIRGKTRCHVLMKLFDRRETKVLIEKLTDIANEPVVGCDMVFEMNPASMI